MAQRKLSRDEATALAERAQSGEFDDDPKAKQAVGMALQEFSRRQAPATDPTVGNNFYRPAHEYSRVRCGAAYFNQGCLNIVIG